MLLACIVRADVLYTIYGHDATCQWPMEQRNVSFPYCFPYGDTSLSLTPSGKQLLWQDYYQPPGQCNSQVDAYAVAPLNTCTNISTDPYYYQFYTVLTNQPINSSQEYGVTTTNFTVLFYKTNGCADQPARKDRLAMHQCHSDIESGSAISFEYFRKNGTAPDVLVAEYWDAQYSCQGVNRGWAYLNNGVCAQATYPSGYYRSWIAFW